MSRELTLIDCVQCGVPMTPGSRGPLPKYCSVACRARARYKANPERRKAYIQAWMSAPVTPDHFNPADDVGYRQAHHRHAKVIDTSSCVRCGAQGRIDIALLPNSPREHLRLGATGKGKSLWYSAYSSDYLPLCRSCHRKLDRSPFEEAVEMIAGLETPYRLVRRTTTILEERVA